MEKLDRLGWAAGGSFKAFGVRIGIRVNDPTVLAKLTKRLPPGWRPVDSKIVNRLYSVKAGDSRLGRGVRRFNLLYGDAARLARTTHLDELLDAFESEVQLYVAESARERIFVHAGVVGWNGGAIVIPGPSFSGKTTLVAELIRAGATYYSDEYAVLDAQGRVHPYARPLSIRDADAHNKPRKYTIEAFGGLPGTRPLPVILVVVSQYKPEANWRPRRLSAGRGLLALLANTVSARGQPDTALATLQQVVLRAPVFKGARGEARRVVDSIVQVLSSPRLLNFATNERG
jgi:hypothetical protein